MWIRVLQSARAALPALTLAVAAVSPGCGGLAARVDGSTPHIQAGEVRFTAPAVRAYGQDRDAEPTDPLARAVTLALIQESVALGGPPIRPSAALSSTASAVAPLSRPGGGVDPDLLDAAASHHGATEPITTTLVTLLPSFASEESIIRTVRQSISAQLSREPVNRVGVGVWTHPAAGHRTLVVLLSNRSVELRPLARVAPVGERVQITGRLAEGLDTPQVFVAGPGGEVTLMSPTSHGDEFRTGFDCARPGPHRVELLARDHSGPRVLFNAPVWCGLPPEPIVRLSTASAEVGDDGLTDDPGVAEQTLMRLINSARADAGLRLVTWDEGAATVAREHSADMRDNGFVAHRSPTTGEVLDRVKRAGLLGEMVLENVAQAASVLAIHRGLMRSPAHRAAILHPDATRVGIGVTRALPDGTRSTLITTQVFLTGAGAPESSLGAPQPAG